MPFPMFLLLIVDEIVDKAAIHRRPGHLRRETRGGGRARACASCDQRDHGRLRARAGNRLRSGRDPPKHISPVKFCSRPHPRRIPTSFPPQPSQRRPPPLLFAAPGSPSPAKMSSMHGNLPPLHMSNIIAADAPLTSPISDAQPVSWDSLFDLALATAPPTASLPNSDPRLAMRFAHMSPDAPAEQCLPTHQLFDFPLPMVPASSPATSPDSSPHTSPQLQHQMLQCKSAGSVVVPAKRPSVSSDGGASKKARGERVTTKEFVPPDVSGLSKREARLVKNRAAAFLSRQRKREEFETMEMYVFLPHVCLSARSLLSLRPRFYPASRLTPYPRA